MHAEEKVDAQRVRLKPVVLERINDDDDDDESHDK